MGEAKTTRNLLRKYGEWCLILLLQCATFGAVAGPEQDEGLEQRKVQRVVENFARAWNRTEPGALARFFTEEAQLITPLDSGNTRQEIHKNVALEYETRLRGTLLSSSTAAIDFPTDNIAVVEGSYQIAGVHGAPGAAKNIEGPFVFRLERNGNEWKISRARLYRTSEKHSAHREAHNERYPFVEIAASEARVLTHSGSFEARAAAPWPVSWTGSVRRVAEL